MADGDRPDRAPPWWRPLLLGTPGYWTAFAVSWSAASTLLLVLFAAILPRPVWLHPVLAASAVIEASFGVFLVGVLRRASRKPQRGKPGA